MERIIKKDKFGDIACNDIIIYTINMCDIGSNVNEFIYIDFNMIKPKYYRTIEDYIIEIWYKNKGIVLNGILKDYVYHNWTLEPMNEISYDEAMKILSKGNKMNRVVYENIDGDIACDNEIIHSNYKGKEGTRQDLNISNWKVINPRYYLFKEDNMLIEIWYDKTGIVLDKGLGKVCKGEKSDKWGIDGEGYSEITYIQAMSILDKVEEEAKDLSYSNKDLMSRVITDGKTWYNGEGLVENYFRGTKEKSKEKDYILEDDKQNNNGGASDYYLLPKNANTLQDLIEYRNMNGSVKDIFKACYRLGVKTEDELRDLNKMAYYSLREIGRITNRKDYITIAKEIIGSQSIEKEL